MGRNIWPGTGIALESSRRARSATPRSGPVGRAEGHDACTLSGAVGVDARGGHEETIRGFGLGDEDVAAWRTSGLTEDAFVDWLTDRVARRPSGLQARQVYGADDVHEFARRAILDALALGSGDHVLDVGCGGGLLLRDALAQGARATGLDHSEDMVALARERAPGSTVVLARPGTCRSRMRPLAPLRCRSCSSSSPTRSACCASAVVFCVQMGGWRSSRPGQNCGAHRLRQNRSQAEATSTLTPNSPNSPAMLV